jgi:general secretion pathway protein G
MARLGATRHTPFVSSGFTLVELVITVAIVAILATAAVPLGELAVTRSREQDLRRNLREIREALDAHKQAWDEGRIARQPGDSGYPKSLDVLVMGVDDARRSFCFRSRCFHRGVVGKAQLRQSPR